MTRTHLIAVGACAIDNILTVPYFPEEDSKLRALSFTKRRGGNCPNSLEVLSQLKNEFVVNRTEEFSPSKNTNEEPIVSSPKLSLIATLPLRSSSQIQFITSSFVNQRTSTEHDDTHPNVQNVAVDLSRCIYRENSTEPVSSYIICSQATSSRTIVNHNELPEMTLDEFVEATSDVLNLSGPHHNQGADDLDQLWFHFEGRIPETTLKCMQYLRKRFTSSESTKHASLRISVELEKPKREGLQELAFEADVIFYSRSWAEAEEYGSAEICLKEQAELLIRNGSGLSSELTLVCTWGGQGASALQLRSSSSESLTTSQQIVRSPAYIDRERPVLDTVGAGDTFIAGMLFGLVCRSENGDASRNSTTASSKTASRRQPIWSLKQKVDFANELAGRKVLQHGFLGLAEKVWDAVSQLDHESGD